MNARFSYFHNLYVRDKAQCEKEIAKLQNGDIDYVEALAHLHSRAPEEQAVALLLLKAVDPFRFDYVILLRHLESEFADVRAAVRELLMHVPLNPLHDRAPLQRYATESSSDAIRKAAQAMLERLDTAEA